MPKLFCVSDVHGFYDELMAALKNAGFNENNEDHWLISCGDNFDRGSQPKEIMNFMNALPRKVLIKGNHEDLLMECIKNKYIRNIDLHNGTASTVYQLASANNNEYYLFEDCSVFPKICDKAKGIVQNFIKQMVDYFETENYVFVHGWIPLKKEKIDGEETAENWRNAGKEKWEDARWTNGMDKALNGKIIDKTIVCGHYHTSYGHHIIDGTPEFDENSDFTPFCANGIIAIDACTAFSNKINVLVLEDEFVKEKMQEKK